MQFGPKRRMVNKPREKKAFSPAIRRPILTSPLSSPSMSFSISVSLSLVLTVFISLPISTHCFSFVQNVNLNQQRSAERSINSRTRKTSSSHPSFARLTHDRISMNMKADGFSKDMKYIRIQPRNTRGNRRTFELQTAVTTLSKTLDNGDISTVDLHSQLHFGDEAYFQFYNDEQFFGSKYDNIF